MNLNFAALITAIMRGILFNIANQARPASSYLFSQFLPEIPRPDYQAKSGNMKVRSTLAGLAAMDSPYPESGLVEVGTFNEETAKIANQATLTEQALRTLQGMATQLQLSGASTNDFLQREMLNFYNKVIVQGHLDTMEYLRGQALINHKIDWKFNKKWLLVDYGINAKYRLANRTGNDAYGGTTSKFWDDVAALQKLLRYNVRALIAHSDTINVILNNQANAVQVTSQTPGRFVIRKMVEQNGTNVPSSDARDTVTLIAYDLEVEVLNPASAGGTIILPVMTRGKILAVANDGESGYIVGQGATPNLPTSLGYTHLAPTVEGGGAMGRWGELFTPEREPYQLVGRGVTNGLPVISAEDKLAVASTDMPA